MKKYIGVFDSGLGGLTNVKELRKIMPCENIVYFGDTGRVPYGSRSNDTIIKYTRQDIRFLMSFPLKAIIVACGTVSSVALDVVKDELEVPIIGVVEPSVKAAINATRNKKIGIIGTEGTIKSESYKKKILSLMPECEIYDVSCPLFVPLVENGYIKSEATKIIAREYLEPIKEKGVDTLILGCTHYPLLTGVIKEIMGDNVSLINPGYETAIYAKEIIKCEEETKGSTDYYVSDSVDKFSYLASMFLEDKIDNKVKKIDIEEW